MAASCPNDNTKEWKQLVSQTGETLAKMAFVANGYVTPDVRPLTEIKKAIGFKSKTENFAKIASKLGRYNAKNGTSHSFDPVRIFGNTFQLTFKPNYLSVSEETRRKKIARKNPNFRVESYDENVRYIEYAQPSTETEGGYFDVNGDFKPLADRESDIDYMIPSNEVNYTLRSATILSSDKGIQIFNKGQKNNWDLSKILTELQVPKEQKQIILDKNINDREEIITSLLADNSFVVEVKTAKEQSLEDDPSFFIYNDSEYQINNGYLKNNINITKEEYYKAVKSYQNENNKNPTQHYANLTVPGGTNYTENEIATPGITPNIKGHAQFSTDNGIGWFRSDEEAVTSKTSTEKDNIRIGQLKEMGYSEQEISEMTEEDTGSQAKVLGGTKTRRILEVQSDLFQKGRDKSNLLSKGDDFGKSYGGSIPSGPLLDKIREEANEAYDKPTVKEGTIVTVNGKNYEKSNGMWFEQKIKSTDNRNKFLQLLNKKGNWVNFFIESIVQDSVKKGYEKVVFPTGETAAKVEGHQTIADEIIKLDEKIKSIENIIKNPEDYYLASIQGYVGEGESHGDKEVFLILMKDKLEKVKVEKQEMKTQGLEKLKPIEAFYSNRVTNILNKLYDTKVITDEHGNTWNEVTLDQNTQEVSDDIDFLIPSANTELVASETIRKRKIDADIVSLRHKLNENIGNVDETLSIKKRIGQLVDIRNNELKGVDKRIHEAKDAATFSKVLGFADNQLKEIELMLKSSTLTADNVQYAQRITDLWIAAGDFSSIEHLMLDEDEANTPSIRNAFVLRKNEAERLQSDIKKRQREFISTFVRQYTDENLADEDIFKLVKDVSSWSAKTLNIARHDNNLLQAIFLGVQEANIKAQREANVVWEDIDALSKKFLKATGNSYSILKQVTDDGLETGRMVNRFSHEFFDIRNKLSTRAFLQKDKNGVIKKNKKDIDTYYEWVNKNTITFDTRLLFEDSQSDITDVPDKFIFKGEEKVTSARKDAHIQELKKQLGEKGYAFYIAKQEKKNEKFKTDRAVKYASIQSDLSDNSQAERDAFFEEWLKEYSPYWATAMLENPKFRQKADKTYYTAKGIREYSVQVPRKYDLVNNETGWYDKNFEKVEANEDILNYHNFVIQTMNDLKYTLPDSQQSILGVGVLPYVEKSLMDSFSEKGMMMGVVPFWDKFKESLTTTDFATEVTEDINPSTGKIYKSIATPFVEDIEAKIIGMVNISIIAFQQENGSEPSSKDIANMRDQAKHELSTNKSWDITRIMKAFALTTLAHKHKSVIKATVEMSVDEFNSLHPSETNKKGEAKKQADGRFVEDKGSGDQLKSALNFSINESFYGIASRKVEAPLTTKMYNNKEKAKKKKLEKLLENEENEENIKILNDELDNLGSVVTGSGVGDTVLKYMTLKGLGWNTFSAFSNIGFGVISNLTNASDGREYSMTQMKKAYMLTVNSIGRNASFNTWDGINSNALKIRTMMDQWDLLQTTNKELFKSTVTTKNPLSRFGPFTMQERSEYLNYAPVMIAAMMNFKATSPDGDSVELWDAMGIDGKLKEGFTADDVNGKPFNEIKMIQKIKRIIEMNHGDYNNALQVKEKFLGRAASQFRTWMFEGFASRFENTKTDWALSYGMDEPYVRKGRYKSYTQGQASAAGATLGTIILPGIGTVIGGGLGFLGGKFLKTQNNRSGISDVMFTIKQLARKAMFQKTQFDDADGATGFSKVDAANMRKNMTELYLMVALYGAMLLLKGASGGDDEEKKSFATNFLLNQVNRLQTDITFYTNPLGAEKLMQTALPIFQILKDFQKLGGDVQHLFDDDMENDTFISGPFKGSNKLGVHLGEFFPGSSQGIRLYRTGDKVW